MRDDLTRSHRQLFVFIHDHPDECHGVRDLMRDLDLSPSTVIKGLRKLQSLGWLAQARAGGPWRKAIYRLTEAGLKAVADFISNVGRFLKRQALPSVQDREKSETTICPTCGHGEGVGSRASVIDDEARARLTTDRLSEVEHNGQVSQSVLGWVAEHCGEIKSPLVKRELEVQVERIGKGQEELIVRFFEYKWPGIQDRRARGLLQYAYPGLFTAMLREGEFRAWKILNAQQLAREARWAESVEDARKGMTVVETASGKDPVAEVEELKASLRAMGASA